MVRKFYLPLILISFFALSAAAQTGEIKGRVLEKGSKEGVPFASVAALLGGAQVQATVTDIDGNYTIKPLNPGKYDVKATSVGYSPAQTSGVIVSTDKISFVDIELGKGIELKAVEIVDYTVPLIDKGNPATQKTVTYEDIQAAPVRDVNSIASQSAGVYQRDEGNDLNIRGSRSDATAYYVDGIKVRGSGVGISNKGTEQITVITGGLPAQYGDVTGGVISVTTRGPSREFTGGIDASSSKLFDDYNNNLISFDLSGPIFTPRDSTGRKSGQPLAGFFVAGDYFYDGDPDPRAIGAWKAKDDKLAEIQQNPLIASTTGSGFNQRAAFFTYDSLEHVNARPNVASQGYRINGKLDFRPVKNVTLTLGGSYDFKDSRQPALAGTRDFYSLFNYENNTQQLDNNWRVFGKITQRFGNSENQSRSASVLKNAYYSIQVDYSKYKTTGQNDQHKDRFFEYGYVGQFVTHKAPFYLPGPSDTINGVPVFAPQTLVLYYDSIVDFHASDLNPVTANYTTQYYNLAPQANGYYSSIFDIPQNQGLINGDNRQNLYVNSLWASPGRVPAGYSLADQTQLRVTASGSADIKNHNIIIGMEYEQRVDRGWNINASLLWDFMRLYENQATGFQTALDATQPSLDFGDLNHDGIVDTIINYSVLNTPTTNAAGDVAPGFHENIHKKLGIPDNQFLDIDAYAPSTYSLDLFSADELTNPNAAILGQYYGYNYTGTKSDAKPSLFDFFYKKDANNNYTREVAPFEPNYTAGYISDKFTVNDLIFNIGVRVDRFDANQKVLKDKYTLWPAHTAGDDASKALAQLEGLDIPSNIKSDYIVYADDFTSPTKIIAFRNGDTWYDRQGTETTDIEPILTSSTGPYLLHPEDAIGEHKKVDLNAFKDYEPQVNVMPRIAFSFPISDEAYFAAHYDILVQRPDENLLRMTPRTYLDWSNGISGTFRNPELLPERTTDYEVAFQQKLSRSSAFSIAAFYKELRDMIHEIPVYAAYPITYNTFGNIDFGTVKGLTFTYDLRRTGNVKMNLSYTLQFADGTGSDAFSNAGLLSNAGQNNLREIKPLDFDQRHTFVASVDYHYGSGKNYDGPVWFNKQFFAKTGLSLVFRAGSGTPYTRQSNIAPTADLTVTSRNVIAGSVNGSRLPWQTRLDLKVDKDFDVKMGKKKDGESRKPLLLNVYFQVLNVLDAENIISVYSTTGNPNDDGYLASPLGIAAVNTAVSPQAYYDQYQIAVNNPNNYSLPRRIRLGVQVNF
jgi:hypothetical protein